MLAKDFRDRIDAIIVERGISRADLARMLGMDPAQVSRRLNGTKAIDLYDVEAIGHALRLRFDLVELPEDAPRPENLDALRGTLLQAFIGTLATIDDADALWLLRTLERMGPKP